MSNDRLWLIAGLGNPGRKYAVTRHNVGFMTVDRIAEENSILINQNKLGADFGAGSVSGTRVLLAKPMAFMNRSGLPLAQLTAYFKLSLDHVLVIHDDIDILFGNLKIKAKGGHGGHNGLRSIIAAAGGDNFPRIRVGIGRPDARMEVTDHVLGKFSRDEASQLDAVLGHAAEAAQTIIEKGLPLSMNRFNRNGVGSDNL
jgi:PTH1 family peptidyl-tRNA hydrolase